MLDFHSRTQLYYQLYDILYKDIKEGVYKPGELLPTESSLIQKYGISRVTVRKAMDLLMTEGLISKRRGYGTFVQNPKVEQNLTQVLHFSHEMEKRGYKASVEVLANEVVLAQKTIADALGIPEGTGLIHVNRLRYADKIPMCIESAYLIKDACPSVLDQDFSSQSLRRFLMDNYNIVWSRARQKIFAINATVKMAQYLTIKTGEPLIYVERISFDQFNKAGEYLQAYYRGDSYYLTVELNGVSG
ncbi:MAG: GntR family transcriptional regulator [Spirochaetaceae bacterium]|jgi:GntR family transcriptional regulator|nr:GntR family transcriptional regulator [Spirochaetaceae bacterium]